MTSAVQNIGASTSGPSFPPAPSHADASMFAAAQSAVGSNAVRPVLVNPGSGGGEQNSAPLPSASPAASGAPSAAAGGSPAGGASAASLVAQIVPLLQQLLQQIQGSGSGASALSTPAAAQSALEPTEGTGTKGTPVNPASAASASPALQSGLGPTEGMGTKGTPVKPGSDASTPTAASPADSGGIASMMPQLISMLQQLLTQLQGGASGSGGAAAAPSSTAAPAAAGGTEAALLKQLLPLLQQQLGATAPAASSGNAPGDLIPLIQKLITELQSGGAQPGAAASGAAAPGVTPPASQQAQPAAASVNPADGIGGAEITAMLANANGTGPQVKFADYDMPAAPAQSSPSTGGQMAGLSAQMGGEAA